MIHKIGLCIGFHSLISASEGLIGHGTGIVNVNVDFKLIVFRPFKGEIIRATITQSTPSGIELSTDFYDDLVVPPETLFDNTSWEKDDANTWTFVWRADDGAGGTNDFYFDNSESCLLRIEEEQWHDLSPDALKEEDEEGTESRLPPYRIRGSMMHSGLGPTLWWVGEGDEEGKGDGADDVEMNGT